MNRKPCWDGWSWYFWKVGWVDDQGVLRYKEGYELEVDEEPHSSWNLYNLHKVALRQRYFEDCAVPVE
eukprot:10576171-Ditylum_brightwellii.AAC.1